MNPVQHGAALLAQGQFEEADAVLASVIDISHEAAGLLAGLRQAQGRRSDAEALYRQALAMMPTYPLASDGLDALNKGLFFPWGKGLFWPERHVFMSAAVYLKRDIGRPLDLLEVGSYVGSSALTWGHACSRFLMHGARLLCVDVWHERKEPVPGEVTFGFFSSGLFYRTFLSNVATLPATVQVDHKIGWSEQILPTLPRDAYDIVYLDGSHYYRDVIDDIDKAVPLVREGGFLCGDDLELQLDECDSDHARLNRDADFILDPRTGREFHVGVTIAMNERFGRMHNYGGFWLLRKTKDGFEPMTLREAFGLLPLHWPRSTIEQLRRRFSGNAELAGIIG